MIGPLNDPSSDFGVPTLQSVALGIEEISAVGGYLNRRIELVVKDDQGKPDEAETKSEELMAEGVVATIGFCNTGCALPSPKVFLNAKTPLHMPFATGTPLTSR